MARRILTNMAIAFAAVSVAALLRVWPLQTLGSGLTWVTFYPAVMVAALYGGLFSAIVATLLCCLVTLFLWPLLAAAPFVVGSAGWLGMGVFVANAVLISALAHAARRARLSAGVLHTLVNTVDEGFCVVEMIHDAKGKPVDYRFIETNRAFVAQSGLDDALGKTMRELVPDHDKDWFEIYGKVARTGESMRFEHPAAAMQRYFDVFAFRIGGKGSNRVGILFKDISERKKSERALIRTAHYDKLTGLPNREMFQDFFTRALARAERSKQSLGLLFLDLDGFKEVNDSFGHRAGDELLQLVARRLSECVRSGDLVSRIGGDEFTVVLEHCRAQNLKEVAEKIIQQIEQPFDLDGKTAYISTSIGIATYPECGASQDTLMQMADAAMYAAKNGGKAQYRFWRPPARQGKAKIQEKEKPQQP
jgi:diguanylate cyclase (GGDEF)-like protein